MIQKMIRKRSVWACGVLGALFFFGNSTVCQAQSRTDEETQKLQSGLAAVLQEGLSEKAIERHLGKLKTSAGTRSVKGPDWELRVEPTGRRDPVQKALFETRNPLAGDLLLEALGLEEPGVVSSSADGADRFLLDLKTQKLPMAKGAEVRIFLKSGEGLRMTDRRWGSSPIWRTSNYPVVRIEIGRL